MSKADYEYKKSTKTNIILQHKIRAAIYDILLRNLIEIKNCCPEKYEEEIIWWLYKKCGIPTVADLSGTKYEDDVKEESFEELVQY